MKNRFFVVSLVIVQCTISQWSTSPNPDSSLYVCPGFTPTIRTTQDGSSFIFGMASYNLWLQKLDPYGYKLWNQPVHVYQDAGPNTVGGVATAFDNDGGIIVSWGDVRGAELDQWFLPTQNAIYMQRINKYGQKVWSDSGLQLAPLNGGSKSGHFVDDGAGGFVTLVIESDFARNNKTNKEWSKLIRYSNSGQKLWELMIDTSSINYAIPNQQIYRIKDNILFFTINGPKIIDIDGKKIQSPNFKNYGGIFTTTDTSIFSIQRFLVSDSTGKLHNKLQLTKVSQQFDSLWSSTFITNLTIDSGDGETAVLPNLLYDGSNGIYFSFGFYYSNPFKFNLYVQHIEENGAQWNNDGFEIHTTYWPVHSFVGKNELGLIFSDFSLQKYNLNGDSVFQQRVQVFNATDFDIDNETIASDNNGGAIIAFWRGGIFAQHTGRTGKLGTITTVKLSNLTPQNIVLKQNYPNPFNTTTTVEYQIPKREKIVLKIYDILGREINTLIDEIVEVGTYRLNYNASALSSGIYFYKLQTVENVQIRKMILVK